MKTLAVDIGNTRVKAAVFDEDGIVKVFSSDEGNFEAKLKDFVRQEGVTNAIASSTSNQPVLLSGFTGVKMIQLDHTTPLPVTIEYETPETLGRDRIAGVVGARKLFPGTTVFVIDAGTCITYDLVTERGVFVGGNIAPGLDMRLKAMHEYTARLPLVIRPEENGLFGKSTSGALQFGAQNGILLEIEGYLRRLETDNGPICTVITGGDAVYFADRLKTEIFVRPNLVLVGLNEILRYNVA